MVDTPAPNDANAERRGFRPVVRTVLARATGGGGVTRLLAVLGLLAAVLLTVPLVVYAQSDTTLSALTVSPKNIIGFTPDRTTYEVGVASDVTQATITGTPNNSGAVVAYSGTDADNAADGHQVDLSAGANEVTVTVTSADTTTTETYTVTVNQGVTDAYGWKAALDLDGLISAGNKTPFGIWSDDTTIWVADSFDGKIYAYRMSDQARDSGKDFDTLFEAGNTTPVGIWSDGTTMWVADYFEYKIYAYRMSDKARDSGKDFDTLFAAGNNDPVGIWSDGTTMWVADSNDGKIYAYRMSDKTHQSSEDFDTLTAAGNNHPYGIWSDGTTMWVADWFDDKIYAYRMSDKARDSDKDFETLSAAGNDAPIGIWSDGTTMWVADFDDDKLYAYRMTDKARDSDKDFETLSAAGNDAPVGIWSDDTTMWVADFTDGKIYAYNMPPPPPGVTVSLTSLTINEGGTGTYTVALNTQPSGPVTVTVGDPTNTDVTVFPTSLTFTTGNWNSPRTVTVTAGQDDDGAEDTAEVTHSVSGYAGVVTAPAVTVTVTDDDTRGVTVTPTTFLLDADESTRYTVVLDTEPVGGSVTVTINDPAGPDVSVSPSSLTFNSSNWNMARTVTVVVSLTADTNRVVHTISHTVSGADYGSVPLPT